MRNGRFTNRQWVTIVVAVCAAVVLAPVGAVAATSAFTVADPVHPAQKARVDRHGALKVGDGSGAVTVDGTVNTFPAARAFTGNYYLSGGTSAKLKSGLKAGTKIMMTSLTVTPAGVSPGLPAQVSIWKLDGADVNCNGGSQSGTTWYYDANANWPSTNGMTFQVPITIGDRCARVYNNGNDSAYVIVTGYLVP
jgi:hypothetical protein